ncbi:MAG: RNA-guided endonuclease TnpB family protein [Acidimicrobiales bacterium]
MSTSQMPEGFHARGVSLTLGPTEEQASSLSSNIGGSRFVYNWGRRLVKDQMDGHWAFIALAIRQGAGRAEAETWAEDMLGPDTWGYEHHRKVLTSLAIRQGASAADAGAWATSVIGGHPWSHYSLRKTWNRTKAEIAPWWADNSKEAYSSGLAEVAAAVDNWRSSIFGKRKGSPMGFPRYKEKGATSESVTFTTGGMRITDARHIQVPKVGIVSVREDLSDLLEAIRRRDLVLRRLTITHHPDGTWIASFGAIERRKVTKDVTNHKAMLRGYDAGITTRLMPSSGGPLLLTRPGCAKVVHGFVNVRFVTKALGISHRSPLGKQVMDAIGTKRLQADDEVASVSRVALATFVAGMNMVQGANPYGRVMSALQDGAFIATCREQESVARSAAESRRLRRRSRHLGRLVVRRTEEPEEMLARMEKDRADRSDKRQARAKDRPYDRGWALPDADGLARKERRRKRYERQMARRREQQKTCRREGPSMRYQESRTARAKAYTDQRNARRDYAHKVTIREARRTEVAVVESLSVKNMMAKGGNHKRGINNGLGNAGLRMVLAFLGYKMEWNGGFLLQAPRFFPSTKRCSRCGHVKPDLALSERVFRCDVCRLALSRDQNAARNLEQIGGVLAYLAFLVAIGVVDRKKHDKMLRSGKFRTSGPVGPTTVTARGVERLQRQATGVVLHGEPRSPLPASDSRQDQGHRHRGRLVKAKVTVA